MITNERIKELEEQIESFATLPYDWNNNGANPISREVINNAKRLLKYLIYEPEIFPTACDTIQFEYDKDLYTEEASYLEVECSKDSYEVYLETKYRVCEAHYELSAMYRVLNDIKIFMNGDPKKSVLFTGAFNPPTIAHEYMITSAVETGGFDYVIFALSNQKFLDRKMARRKAKAYSEEDRLNMILEMTWMYENVLIFGIEAGYTYEVLKEVKAYYRIPNLYFALGSDKLKEIEKWGFQDKLLKDFNFYILKRTDSDEYVENECKRIFTNTKYIIGEDNEKYKNISSTQVRNCIKDGKDFSELVSIGVRKYLLDMDI